MSACLWNDIDVYLAAAVVTEMGSTLTLPIQQVLTAERLNLVELTLPAVLVAGWVAESDAGSHGDGVVHVDERYLYTLAAICDSATVAGARSDALELRRRLRGLITSRVALGCLTSSDGERVTHTRINRSNVEVSGPTRCRYIGTATVELDVFTEI